MSVRDPVNCTDSFFLRPVLYSKFQIRVEFSKHDLYLIVLLVVWRRLDHANRSDADLLLLEGSNTSDLLLLECSNTYWIIQYVCRFTIGRSPSLVPAACPFIARSVLEIIAVFYWWRFRRPGHVARIVSTRRTRVCPTRV